MSAPPNRSDIESFRAIIGRRLGLAFDDTKLDSMAELLARRCASVRTPVASYLARLDTAAAADLELGVLAEELTVCETYFYRHAEQLRAFAEGALPSLLEQRADARRIRVLSAGCASGDEPFSLAMLLRDHERAAGWSFEIRAVDVNRAALAKAARGIYTPWSLRETPAAARRRWFRSVGRDFEVDPSIRAMVTFEERNLAAPGADLLLAESYDVVFCRNMLMYFDVEQARELVSRLTRALVPGGFLFLGHAETLRGLSHDFHIRHSHGAFYYERRNGPARSEHPRDVRTSTVREHAPLVLDESVSWVEAISRASQRVSELAARSDLEAAASSSAEPRGALGTQSSAHVRSAMELLEAERFTDALDHLRRLPSSAALDPDVLLLRCALHAHRGALADAEATCRELLRTDELNAGAHYVLALCREGTGDREGAIEHDRIAAHLDPEFAMPRLHLGLSARRAGDHVAARTELARAIELLRRDEPSRILLFGGGFTREALIMLCRRELQACGGEA